MPIIEHIIDAALEKKATNVVCLDLRRLHIGIADYFIICDADNSKQSVAIADNIEMLLYKDLNIMPYNKEGYSNADWILLDYGDTLVHIFKKEKRYFYDLESLWGDAEIKVHN
ncbi:MAG: ribosome silencing factor [Solitalea-like symbiont of Tyrophagus putrescentiae]